MAKISTLPVAGPLLGAETLPIVQSGEMRRAALAAVLAQLEAAGAVAQAFAGPPYASRAAGEAATSAGEYFAVNVLGLVTIYLRTVGGSDEQWSIATRSALGAADGAALLGYGANNVAGILGEKIHLRKFGTTKAALRAALDEQQASGGVLILPPGEISIAGWDEPYEATDPLFIAGQHMQVSALRFPGSVESFVHQLHPLLAFADFTLLDLANPTSGNGGGAVYALAADALGAPASSTFQRMRFDGCTAPINIEVPFDGPEVLACEYLNGHGHGLRFGTTTGVAAWGTWRRAKVNGWKVRNLATTGPGQNVYAALAYGEDHFFDGFDIDGVVGTMDRNGNAWPTEAGGLHFQCRKPRVGANNVSRNVSGSEVVRHLMIKGEVNGTDFLVEGWKAYCGGIGTGVALYGKHGTVKCDVDDPGVAAVEIGSALEMTSVHLHVVARGTGRANAYGVVGSFDSGDLVITGELTGFTKPMSISASAGGKSLSINVDTSGGNGNAVDVYFNSSIEQLVVAGRRDVAGNNVCCWLRGASSAATIGKATVRGACATVGGFGTVLDTVTFGSLDLDQHVTGVTVPGRELSGTAIIKAGSAKTNLSATTSNATPVNSLSLPVPNGTSLTVEIRANGRDGTDDYQITREYGFGATGGAAQPRGSFARLVSFSAGAATWNAAAVNSGANAVVQFTGGATPVKHTATATLTFAG